MKLESLLFEALSSDKGVVITTSDPERLKQKLYKVRKRDPDFSVLSFLTSPDNPLTELLILKKPE